MNNGPFNSLFEFLLAIAMILVGIYIGVASLIAWLTGTYILTDPPKPKPEPAAIKQTLDTHRKPWITITLGGHPK